MFFGNYSGAIVSEISSKEQTSRLAWQESLPIVHISENRNDNTKQD